MKYKLKVNGQVRTLDAPEDIPLLCDYFLDKFRQRYQRNVKTLAPSVYHLLIRNRWPGNVRELENAIERAVLVAKNTEIQVGDLPETIREDFEGLTQAHVYGAIAFYLDHEDEIEAYLLKRKREWDELERRGTPPSADLLARIERARRGASLPQR